MYIIVQHEYIHMVITLYADTTYIKGRGRDLFIFLTRSRYMIRVCISYSSNWGFEWWWGIGSSPEEQQPAKKGIRTPTGRQRGFCNYSQTHAAESKRETTGVVFDSLTSERIRYLFVCRYGYSICIRSLAKFKKPYRSLRLVRSSTCTRRTRRRILLTTYTKCTLCNVTLLHVPRCPYTISITREFNVSPSIYFALPLVDYGDMRTPLTGGGTYITKTKFNFEIICRIVFRNANSSTTRNDRKQT